eukprot:6138631-Amphidinium_carterae.4
MLKDSETSDCAICLECLGPRRWEEERCSVSANLEPEVLQSRRSSIELSPSSLEVRHQDPHCYEA